MEVINEKKENQNSLSINLKKYIKFSFNNSEQYKNINIIEQFIDNPNIINDKSNLIIFLEELINLLNLGNNILIPFLEICPILIKSYIQSDIDEDKDFKYLHIFKLLKINSFMSREYLYPIYEYFSDLLYVINDIEENDKKLKKFNKIFELWKIFYDFELDISQLEYFNTSSYCFIGGGLKVNLPKEIDLKNNSFTIKINLFNNISSVLNKNLILFRVENDSTFDLNWSFIENYINKEKKVKIIFIVFQLKEITIKIKEKEKEKEKENEKDEFSFFLKINKDINTIKDFNLLENFYGQIQYLELIENKKDINNNEDILIDEIFKPYPLADDGYLYHISQIKNENKNNKNENNKNENNINNINENNINKKNNNINIRNFISNIKNKNFMANINNNKNNSNKNTNNNDLNIISIKVINKDLVKANYINYLESDFDIFYYIGGIIQFAPFPLVINGINSNKKINFINGIDKKKYLIIIFDKNIVY